jgi:hypothetical protein
MTELKDLENRLKSISNNDWNKLFRLITEIEETSSFGEMKGGDKNPDGTINMPYINSAKVVDDFFHLSHEIGIVPEFDWTNWSEGREIINNNETDYSKLDTETLCKLLTVIIRTDRFNEGFLVSCFENGIIPKILYGLKQNIYG